ncbi:unnamed protein product [Lampetra fluviatilis]
MNTPVVHGLGSEFGVGTQARGSVEGVCTLEWGTWEGRPDGVKETRCDPGREVREEEVRMTSPGDPRAHPVSPPVTQTPG